MKMNKSILLALTILLFSGCGRHITIHSGASASLMTASGILLDFKLTNVDTRVIDGYSISTISYLLRNNSGSVAFDTQAGTEELTSYDTQNFQGMTVSVETACQQDDCTVVSALLNIQESNGAKTQSAYLYVNTSDGNMAWSASKTGTSYTTAASAISDLLQVCKASGNGC